MLANPLEIFEKTHLAYCRFLNKIRRIHLRDEDLNDAIGTFIGQYSVPASFWDQEGVGSFGQRRASSEACGQPNGNPAVF